MRASRATLERYKTDGIFACRLANSGKSQAFLKIYRDCLTFRINVFPGVDGMCSCLSFSDD